MSSKHNKYYNKLFIDYFESNDNIINIPYCATLAHQKPLLCCF